MKRILLLLLLLCSVCTAQNSSAANDTKTPRVYVNGSYSDMQYLKEQIPIVDYVVDRKDADVHVLVTKQSTGSGGYMYSIYMYGQNQFNKMNDTVKIAVNKDDSDDKTRIKIVNGIKTGLFNYLKNSSVSNMMTINYDKVKEQVKQKDPWDSWIFGLNLNGYFSGESSDSYTSVYSTLSASRTTEDLRLGLSLSNSYGQSIYNYTDYDYVSIRRSYELYGNIVKSISDHWSVGSWADAYRSTYSNIDFSWVLTTGLEYNFFPYSQSSQQQLRLAYKIGMTHNKYFEETVYFKESEYLATQNASISLDLTQPWGSVSTSLSASNYLQDLQKYNFSFYANCSLKLVKGLSLNFSFNYSKINNQISLARGDASVEEVLLSTRQLETDYSYYSSVGLSFSFGSIYNSIVNPRFGN